MRALLYLCDAAQTRAGRLNLIGGGLDSMPPFAPDLGSMSLPHSVVAFISMDRPDLDKVHTWELMLVRPDGGLFVSKHNADCKGDGVCANCNTLSFKNKFELPYIEGMTLPAIFQFAVSVPALPYESGCKYTWRLAINDQTRPEWAIQFTVGQA